MKVHPMLSVPIRGLFNLTGLQGSNKRYKLFINFPSPLGDYLI